MTEPDGTKVHVKPASSFQNTLVVAQIRRGEQGEPIQEKFGIGVVLSRAFDIVEPIVSHPGAVHIEPEWDRITEIIRELGAIGKAL